MTGIEVNLQAWSEQKTEWADMSAETQVIYAFLREAIENAGYEVNTIEVEMTVDNGTSIISCKVVV